MKKHDHDAGLAHDLALLRKIAHRRQVLRMFAGASLIPLFGCGGSTNTASSGGSSSGGSSSGGSSSGGSSSSSSGSPDTCSVIPTETAGPYPGDGSNGANALSSTGIVRSDIRSSFAGRSGVADGVLLRVDMTIVNAGASCAALAGYAVYIWHCDKDGSYSLYTLPSENYLRGVQETDATGKVSFTTVFPGAYLGRWPHIHFEIFPNLASASSSAGKIATSQLALPDEACRAAYAAAGYAQSAANFPQTTLASDNVFRDGVAAQLAAVTGDVTNGFLASLMVGITA